MPNRSGSRTNGRGALATRIDRRRRGALCVIPRPISVEDEADGSPPDCRQERGIDMNKFVILLLVALAVAVGYLVGTEQGRARRAELTEALNNRHKATGTEDTIDLAADAEDVVEPILEAQSV